MQIGKALIRALQQTHLLLYTQRGGGVGKPTKMLHLAGRGVKAPGEQRSFRKLLSQDSPGSSPSLSTAA